MEHKEEANLIPEFQNLTHLELGYSECTRDWVDVLEVIQRCPNLQILDIDMVWWVELTFKDDFCFYLFLYLICINFVL